MTYEKWEGSEGCRKLVSTRNGTISIVLKNLDKCN